MFESFVDIFKVGGKRNSLGRSQEVLDIVLSNKSRLSELFDCINHDDAWVRMRAIDTLEKVCRIHPSWITPYIDAMLNEITEIDQASIRWHLAQIFKQIQLTDIQRDLALKHLELWLSDNKCDWIVSANSIDALAHFVREGYYQKSKLLKLLQIQVGHKSNAVKKRASKLIEEFS